MSSNKKVPYPSEKEIEKQITLIMEQGLSQKQSFIRSFFEIKNQLSWGQLLLNRGETLFTGIVFLIAFCILLVLSDDPTVDATSFYVIIFTISPLIFLSLSAHSYYQKQSNATFELEMTMKYTVFQLLTFRMLSFSGVGVLINVSLILLLSINVEFNVWQALLLSLSGLFLFAGLLLFAIRKGSVLKRSVLFIGTWISSNLFLFFFIGKKYENFLVGLPTVIYLVILVGCVAIFINSLKQLFYRKYEGAFAC